MLVNIYENLKGFLNNINEKTTAESIKPEDIFASDIRIRMISINIIFLFEILSDSNWLNMKGAAKRKSMLANHNPWDAIPCQLFIMQGKSSKHETKNVTFPWFLQNIPMDINAEVKNINFLKWINKP